MNLSEGLQKNFGGLNQKSAKYVRAKSIFTLILKVSDKFIGQNGVLRYGHFSDFLEYFFGIEWPILV